MGALPPRDAEAEEAFIQRFQADGDDPALLDAVYAAVEDRRWMLAARLVQLVPEGHDDADLQRARQAAHLVLHRQLGPADASWSAMEDAMRALHRERVSRAKHRQRLRAAGSDRRVGRLALRRTRRR